MMKCLLLTAMMVFLITPAASALSISVEPNTFNNSYANNNTKLNFTLNDIGNLWLINTDNSTENIDSLVGKVIPISSFIEDIEECKEHHLSFIANNTNETRILDLVFVYDNEPPSKPIITSPEEGVYSNNTVVVSWEDAEDTCSGLNPVPYNINLQCDNYTEYIFLEDNSQTFDLPNGFCSLTIAAYDNIETTGSSNKAKSTVNFTIDDTGPQITIMSPTTDIHTDAVWVNVTTNKESSCEVNNESIQQTMETDNNLSFASVLPAQNGINEFVVKCIALNGIMSNASITTNADLTAPIKTLESVSGDKTAPYSTNKSLVELYINLDEEGTCKMSIYNKSYDSMNSSDITCSSYNITRKICTQSFAEGNHTIFVACSDGYFYDSKEDNLRVDFTVNVFNNISLSMNTEGYVRAGKTRDYILGIENKGNGNLTELNLSIETSMSDGWYGISKTSIPLLEFNDDKNIVINVSPPTTATNKTYTFIIYANSTEVSVKSKFSVRVVNTEPVEIVQQTITSTGGSSSSGTPPAIGSTWPSGFLNTRDITVWVTTDKKAACRMDANKYNYNNLVREMTSNAKGTNHTQKLTNLANGPSTYYVLCKDEDGNIMKSHKSFTFTIDVAPPVTKVTGINENGNTFDITWEGEDKISGIQSYTIQFMEEEGDWQNWMNDTTKTSGTFNTEPGKLYKFRSIGKDKAGNTELKLFVYYDIDITSSGEKQEEQGSLEPTGFVIGFDLGNLDLSLIPLQNFIEANSIPLILLLVAVPIFLLLVKTQTSPNKGKTLRKNVIDDWRKIRKSIKN